MKTKTFLSVIAIITSFAFSSCVKDGPVGPQGPAGTNGTNGNANVTSLIYQVATSVNWSISSGSNPYYYANFQDNDLTQAIHDNGSVQVFFSIDNGTTYEAVPYTYVASTNYYMSFTTVVDYVQVAWNYGGGTLGSDPNTVFGATCQFKVICIAAGARLAHPNVNYKNYQEVKKAFNLKD